MRTKITIIGLLVVITASIVSIANHANVLWTVSIPVKNEISVSTRSLNSSATKQSTSSIKKVREIIEEDAVSKDSFVTLVADGVPYKVHATTTQTILEVMRTLEKTTDFSFKGTEFSGIGLFVDEINHKKSAGGYYWMLYVNMLAAQKGVSQVFVSPGDKILWQYEKNRHQ